MNKERDTRWASRSLEPIAAVESQMALRSSTVPCHFSAGGLCPHDYGAIQTLERCRASPPAIVCRLVPSPLNTTF